MDQYGGRLYHSGSTSVISAIAASEAHFKILLLQVWLLVAVQYCGTWDEIILGQQQSFGKYIGPPWSLLAYFVQRELSIPPAIAACFARGLSVTGLKNSFYP